MARIAKSADRIGMFSRSANSAPPPVRFDIRAPGDFREGVAKVVAQGGTRRALHELSDESQRHPTKRYAHQDGHPKVTTDRDEGGAYTVTPAQSVDELRGQIRLLIRAFEESEGRYPSADDKGFWEAYARVTNAFVDRLALGSPKRAAEPLATSTAVRKRRKPKKRKRGRPTPVTKSRANLPATFHVIETK